ncbi:MAG: histidinol-phosphate transaminase [Lentisphaerae bacterium]|nr:histidinol-phosphate transaminase [Lentisphaerota bacterium]
MTALARPGVADLAVYEPGRPIEEVARELGFANADDIVKLASNENPFGPSPKALRAMRRAAADMHRYPDGGAFYLRQAIAAKLEVRPGQVLVGSGSNEILELIGHVFLDASTDIVVADRAFVVYRLIGNMFGAGVISVPMKDYTHDLDAMADAITPRTRVVFIANPNNPTGTLVGQAEIDRFMRRVPAHVVVCFDEAYGELLPRDRQPEVLPYVRQGRNVMTVRTFSKTYGLAGLRIGYVVAPEEGIALLHRVRQPFNVNAMALAAARAALEDDAFVEKIRRLVARELDFYRRKLTALKLNFIPSVANFLLVEVGEGRRVFEALQRERVIVRPMDGYGLPRHVRITVGTRRENERCIEALAKVLGRA